MKVSLSEIFHLDGTVREMNCDFEQEVFRYSGAEYEITDKSPVCVRLSKSGTNTILFRLSTSFSIIAPCDRCLEPVVIPFEISAENLLKMDDNGRGCAEDDEEPVNYIDGYELDIDAFIGEEIMIGFPMKVLCNEECKGLCTVCGANLNRGECGCDRTVLDPRMSIIRDLFQQKEV